MQKKDFSGEGEAMVRPFCRGAENSKPSAERFGCECSGCGRPMKEPSFGLQGYPLASVYSPLQEWNDIYDIDTALKRGTIFKELDLPFYGSGCSPMGDGRFGGGRNGR